MSILEKISKEDPNWIADDDHLDRKDLTKAEFKEACEELKKKFGMKEGLEKEPEKGIYKPEE